MSIMSGLFPGFANGGAEYNNNVSVQSSGSLQSGGRPSEVSFENSRHTLSKLSILPDATSKEDVVAAARTAGAAQAQDYKLKKLARHQLSIVDSALSIAETKADYAANMMQREEKWQRLQSKHGKAVSRFALGTEETAANFNGFQDSMNSAYNSLNL